MRFKGYQYTEYKRIAFYTDIHCITFSNTAINRIYHMIAYARSKDLYQFTWKCTAMFLMYSNNIKTVEKNIKQERRMEGEGFDEE